MTIFIFKEVNLRFLNNKRKLMRAIQRKFKRLYLRNHKSDLDKLGLVGKLTVSPTIILINIRIYSNININKWMKFELEFGAEVSALDLNHVHRFLSSW